MCAAHPRPRRRARTVWLVSSAVVVALAIIWFIAALVVFVLPQQQPLRQADAIVALSPPHERLPIALGALEEGLAARLWISNVDQDLEPMADGALMDELCASDSSAVECFVPLSEDTIGEARAVAQLVRDSRAESVIVVTHTSHAARTQFLFERCLPRGTDFEILLVEETRSPVDTLRRMIYETAAAVKAATEVHDCDI